MADVYNVINKVVLEVNNKIEDFIVKSVNDYTGEQHITVNAQKIAEAVQKQIPKVPTYEGDGYADGQLVYDTWMCPNCGKSYEVDYDNYNYCPECGQRVNLSEV